MLMNPSRLVAVAMTLALAGCVQGTPSPRPQPAAAPQAYASERYTPQGFTLPAGAGCRGDVSRFRAIMGNDYSTGNVNLSVYKQIVNEIDQADQVCTSGDSARASAMVRATKSKFGYP